MMEYLLLLFALMGGGAIGQQNTIPTIEEPTTAKDHYVPRDMKLELTCRAKGDPSYKWHRNKKLVQPELNFDGETLINFDSRSGTLTIPKYSERFNGIYQCFATNNEGSSTSMSQEQRVYETRLPAFTRADDAKFRRDEYDYVALECSNQGKVVGARKDLSYNWYLTDGSSQVDMDNGRLFIDYNGDLHFSYVLKDDETTTDKKYLCGYSFVESLKKIIMGNNNLLKVDKVINPQGIEPVLQYSTKVVKGILGSSAQLECFFSGYDKQSADHLPTIKWFDNSHNEITNSDKYELSKKGRVLIVNTLKEEDDKYFFCQGFTTGGNSEKHSVYLDVTSKPLWLVPPKTQTKAEEQDAVFECSARSLSNEAEPETPKWFVNGEKFDSSKDHHKYKFSNNGKKLTIMNLKKIDIQCIQCIVTNHIGSLMGDACLNVVTPIKIQSQPPEEQSISKGDIVHLTVKATSGDDTSNPLSYEWHFNNMTYNKPNVPPFVTYDPRNDLTFINTSLLKRSEYEKIDGLYECRIFNLYDSVTIQTMVKLSDIKPVPVTASAGIDMWIIGLVIGIIFLFIVIAIIIFVICRKQQEGDYNVDKKETGAGLDPEKELRDKGFNDLSRPDYDDYFYPEKKPRGDLEYDDVPIGGDDESLGEYGDEEDTHFNEDGSFIGIYQKKENERQNHKAESTI